MGHLKLNHFWIQMQILEVAEDSSLFSIMVLSWIPLGNTRLLKSPFCFLWQGGLKESSSLLVWIHGTTININIGTLYLSSWLLWGNVHSCKRMACSLFCMQLACTIWIKLWMFWVGERHLQIINCLLRKGKSKPQGQHDKWQKPHA